MIETIIALVAVAAVICAIAATVLAIVVLAKLLLSDKAQPTEAVEDDMPEAERSRSKEIAEGIENLLSYKADI